MDLRSWLRRLVASVGPDDEAAAREEYRLHGRGETDVARQRSSGSFATDEAADAAKAELDELERPPDPNP